MREIQLGLIDVVSSTRSLSVLLSAVETSLRTHAALEIAHQTLAGFIICVLVAATIQGWRLFHSELPIVQLLFEGGVYSRV